MKKDFAYYIRQKMGISVQWLGTRPIRLRAWPRGTHWQGWYAQGKTKEEAYENLVRFICDIPAFWWLRGRAEIIIDQARTEAREE